MLRHKKHQIVYRGKLKKRKGSQKKCLANPDRKLKKNTLRGKCSAEPCKNRARKKSRLELLFEGSSPFGDPRFSLCSAVCGSTARCMTNHAASAFNVPAQYIKPDTRMSTKNVR